VRASMAFVCNPDSEAQRFAIASDREWDWHSHPLPDAESSTARLYDAKVASAAADREDTSRSSKFAHGALLDTGRRQDRIRLLESALVPGKHCKHEAASAIFYFLSASRAKGAS